MGAKMAWGPQSGLRFYGTLFQTGFKSACGGHVASLYAKGATQYCGTRNRGPLAHYQILAESPTALFYVIREF